MPWIRHWVPLLSGDFLVSAAWHLYPSGVSINFPHHLSGQLFYDTPYPGSRDKNLPNFCQAPLSFVSVAQKIRLLFQTFCAAGTADMTSPWYYTPAFETLLQFHPDPFSDTTPARRRRPHHGGACQHWDTFFDMALLHPHFTAVSLYMYSGLYHTQNFPLTCPIFASKTRHVFLDTNVCVKVATEADSVLEHF